MKTFLVYLLPLLICISVGVNGDSCDIKAQRVFEKCPSREVEVGLGEEVTLVCRTKSRIDICTWINPNGTNTRPYKDHDSYVLTAKSNRDCDMRIISVKKDDIGNWQCNPFVAGESQPMAVDGYLKLRSTGAKTVALTWLSIVVLPMLSYLMTS